MFTYSAASSVISFEYLTDVLISTCSMRSFQFPIYPIICLPHYSLYWWQCNNPLKANNMSHPWLFAFNMHLIYQKILSTLLKMHTECERMSPLTASLYFKNILALSFWYKDYCTWWSGDFGNLLAFRVQGACEALAQSQCEKWKGASRTDGELSFWHGWALNKEIYCVNK